jgi:hypothetical protein
VTTMSLHHPASKIYRHERQSWFTSTTGLLSAVDQFMVRHLSWQAWQRFLEVIMWLREPPPHTPCPKCCDLATAPFDVIGSSGRAPLTPYFSDVVKPLLTRMFMFFCDHPSNANHMPTRREYLGYLRYLPST